MMHLDIRSIVLLAAAFLGMVGTCSTHRGTIDPSQYYVPFRDSMDYTATAGHGWERREKYRERLWRNLYARNSFQLATPSIQPKTPKRIHQIWVGGKLPEKYKAWQKTWQELHPDWEYRLWTDADVKGFGMENYALFKATSQLGAKADIWRYEILDRYGGLYVDMDFECLIPFDMFHHCYDFFTGIENSGGFQVANGLIGARPHHPAIRGCIDAIKKIKPRRYDHDTIYDHTGPPCLTRALISYVENEPTDSVIALPHSYFYSVPLFYDQPVETYLCPESFAVHHWAGEWIDSRFYQEERQQEVAEQRETVHMERQGARCTRAQSSDWHYLAPMPKHAREHLLVVAPHPDDDVIGCGGTIANAVAADNKVSVVYLTSGERGLMVPEQPSHAASAKVREGEALQAALVLGVHQVRFLRYPDGGLQLRSSYTKKLAEIIAQLQPTHMYVPHRSDAHSDHQVAYHLARKALLHVDVSPQLLCYEVWTPLHDVTHLEDISEVMDTKLAALRKHASQVNGIRYDHAVAGINAYRGVINGAFFDQEWLYAEGFCEGD